MDITSSQSQRHSERDFSHKLTTYLDSGAGIVHVRTNEIIRATLAIRKQCILDGYKVQEWDIVNGFRTVTGDTLDKVATAQGDGNIDIGGAFMQPLEAIRTDADEMQCFVFVCPHVFMENNPTMTQLMLTYSFTLPETNVAIILVTPDMPLPNEAETKILSIAFDPPGHGELRESFDRLLAGVDDTHSDRIQLSEDDYNRICFTGAGMSAGAFEMYCAVAITEASRGGSEEPIGVEEIIDGVSIGKTDVVNSSDILELYPSTDISNVGGLENLKEWVARRKDCYSDEAKEFGIEPPKGIVLVGPPGTGKSLTAKAVSKELGVPLVRLDFGRVFNSLVGASEQRMRSALKMVETMAPCVLFCDEIDKGLGGIGGSGDSGTSNRVLGSFLTWLQDCKAPVFVMVTANNVTGLPPEMLRRGRFDAIFSTTMPNADEREAVLGIHLAIRGRDIADFPEQEVAEIIALSDSYVPAEIESAVKEGLVDAFNAGEEMSMAHVKHALKTMVPLSRAFAVQIAAMNDWAKNNATPASKELAERKERGGQGKTSRISTRSRGVRNPTK